MKRHNLAIVLLGVGAVVGAASLYTVGYFQIGSRWGTETFREMERASTPEFPITMQDSGPPWLDRIYPNGFFAAIFQPPAHLESWLTGIDVRAIDGSKVTFDFTIDPPPPAVIEFDDASVTYTSSEGVTESVRWADLSMVMIKTMADEPVGNQVWMLVGGETSGCTFTSDAQGFNKVIERLQQLPGFDPKVAIKAAACTDDNMFLCWQRQGT